MGSRGVGGESKNLRDEVLCKLTHGSFFGGLAGGFGYVVGRAAGEGFNRDRGAALSQRAAHDDR